MATAADSTGTAVRKFYQVRVKSIKFHESDAIAIYFYDVTHHIESLKSTNYNNSKEVQQEDHKSDGGKRATHL